ncbi:family 43 glycosylhydrolase [Dysgonomonas sp. Marseille-P4361]|uniref:glycoside hydrolase family 43 protein n=1 Tax=Dysgonomonas sp. Marseille-P4361 TaxID=2161820 RepID=UPI000D55D592|nr:glycoside hydrolase family 43 protein [Dysgonomonas sp. Marseille-P4361]
MNKNTAYFIGIIFSIILLYSCNSKETQSSQKEIESEATFTNPLLPTGARPWATFYNGEYFYLQDADDRIILWRTNDITNIKNAPSKEIWIPKDKNSASHLWAPELHRIDGKWYIYFAADDGNTDNHQLYVIENEAEDPFEGEFIMKGRIKTDKEDNWAIHPSVFKHKEELYLIWSGWQTRRIETETQCIYIAKMENPWTLASERVLISKPEYEWERQWINPDGSKTGYPIYVNEDPQCYYTKDKNKILIYYAASGTWTPYYAVGLLAADSNSDLLDAKSWTKSEIPVFIQNIENQVFATGTPCFIPSPDGEETYFLYQARSIEKEPYGSLPASTMDTRSPRLQKMEWDEDGVPILGEALSEIEKIKKPSGTK